MITANAIISDVIADGTKVWVEFEVEGKFFPVHYEFNTSYLNDFTRLMFLLNRTKTKNIKELVGKAIRVVDTEAMRDSVVAVGDRSKDKFVDLFGSEFTVKEKKIYQNHKQK